MKKKKKHGLESRLRIAEGTINLLIEQNRQLLNLVEKQEQVNSQNVQATNARFDYLEKKVADKISKKSWFNRK
ncbi:hypothetical protein [Streptococcus cuniculi]|nr:hypothetical protein [Streptococcus cuniculi]